MRAWCRIGLALLALAGTVVRVWAGQSNLQDKKIIMGGGMGMPHVRDLAEHVAAMEAHASFDGVAIYPPYVTKGDDVISIGHPFYEGRRLDIEDFEEAAASLQASRATRYRHNFLWTYVTTGDVEVETPDWFDPEFDTVVHNWKVEAEFCKRAGLAGIMFDSEQYYGRKMFSYLGAKYRDAKTAQEYAERMFACGARIMRAVNSVYPDIRIMFLNGPSIYAWEGDGAAYGMTRHFFDGMLSQCAGKAQMIDGFGHAYGFRHGISYSSSRRMMKQRLRGLSRVPDKFDRHFRAAFAVIIGPNWPYGISDVPFPEDVSRSYYTPAEFEYALNQALEYSDEYVWTYSLGCSWWEGGAKEPGDVIPQAYRDALLAAKRPHPYIPVLRNLDAHVALRPGSALPPRKLSQPVRGYAEADEFQTYDEEVTFGALWTEYRFLADLPHLWRFRIDPYDTGVKEGWFGPVVNERNWLWITSELPWDNQGYRLYDGYGWYRQEFDAPALPDDTKVFLAFGGVAHGAEVYLNGTKVGEHNMDSSPWESRRLPDTCFLIDVSGSLKSGQENLLAVRVVDYGMYGGGIWKPVKLIARK